GRIEFRSALDGRVVNAGVDRYETLNGKHLAPLGSEELSKDAIYLEVQTNQSKVRVSQAARTRILKNGQRLTLKPNTAREPGYIARYFTGEVNEGDKVYVEKVVVLFTSHDRGISDCSLAARKALAEAGSFGDLFQSHVLAWEHLWRRF